MEHKFEKYCKDYKNIENYDKAAADNFKGWLCHHRRGVDFTQKELITLGMYYNRPAAELIFITLSEHSSLHNKGKIRSEDTKKKICENHKGMLGKHHSEETKKKQSEAKKAEKNPNYGKHPSEETKKRISEKSKNRCKGFHWYNNGEINKFCYECPEGFVPGMLRK